MSNPLLWLKRLLVTLVFAAPMAHGQGFPSRPLTLMAAWPAGGASDFVARLMGKELAVLLGQPVVIENAPGAGGSIGTNKAMAAPPDGHMMMLSSPLDMILAPLTFNAATYKPEEAKTIALLGRTDVMLVGRKDLGANSLPELIALMKASTAKPLSYCSAGRGSLYHLIGERMNSFGGVTSLHVPYTGFPQCITDMVGGQIDFAFLPIGGPFPGFADNGSIKVLATLGEGPSVRFPKVAPAMATKGFEDFRFSVWAGIHVNGKVPDANAQVLNKAAYEALAKPEVRKSIEASGATVVEPLNLQQAQAAYLKEVQIYQAIARSVGISRQ